jgi:hypothetical protein
MNTALNARLTAVAASVSPPAVVHDRPEPQAPQFDALPVAPQKSTFDRLLTAAWTDSHRRIHTPHLHQAAEAEHKDEHGSTIWPRVAGAEMAALDLLAAELNRLRGHAAKPQAGCDFIRLSLGGTDVLVEYEYSAGKPGRLWGPPEDCYEDEPEEVNILQVLVNGSWIDVDVFSPSVLERWEQAIRDHYAEQIENDMADRAERERDHG